MKILALTDMHGDTEHLGIISDDLAEADLVLLTGDLTHFGREKEASQIVQAVRKYNDCILAVPGNCDYPEVDDYLAGEGVSLHRRNIVIDQITFLGVGGSLQCPGVTPNEATEEEFRVYLEEAVSTVRPDMPMVLVTHQPLYGTVVDLARSGKNVGSKKIRHFVDQFHPMICFSGHIHEARGIGSIGKTKVVNPGPLREGGYAYTVVKSGVEAVEIRGIRE